MKVYKDIQCTQGNILYIGTDANTQAYIYLRCEDWYKGNKCNIDNIAFIPIFTFMDEHVSTTFFKPVIGNIVYDVHVVPRFIFNNCIRTSKWLNTKDYIELNHYSYDNAFMINGYYMNPLYKISEQPEIKLLNYDDRILSILEDNKCAWMFLSRRIVPVKSEYVDLAEAYKINDAIDLLNELDN